MGNKFFFEEDPKAEESGVSWQEHADSFYNHLGVDVKNVDKQKDAFAPMTPVAMTIKMKTINDKVIEIEYGQMGDDYVIHIKPIHPTRNLAKEASLLLAMRTTIALLNTVIPYDLRVEIYKPEPQWEMKFTTYKIIDGMNAWNLKIDKLENEVIPQIQGNLTQICMKS